MFCIFILAALVSLYMDNDNLTAQIGGYTAGPGYDAVSGWGTPNGKKLAQAIAQAID